MSEYTKQQLSTLKEDVEIFKAVGLNWLSRTCNREYKNIRKQIRAGYRK